MSRALIKTLVAVISLAFFTAAMHASAKELPSGFAGTWNFDVQTSAKEAKSDAERKISMHFKGVVFIFNNDCTFTGPQGVKGDVNVINKKTISIKLEPDTVMTFELKENKLKSSMKWSDSLTIHPYYSQGETNLTSGGIPPVDVLFVSAEPIDGTYSYCMFTKDGYAVFNDEPFKNPTKALKSRNPNNYVTVDGKVLINGGMMKAAFKGDGFMLNNQGLKISYIKHK